MKGEKRGGGRDGGIERGGRRERGEKKREGKRRSQLCYQTMKYAILFLATLSILVQFIMSDVDELDRA